MDYVYRGTKPTPMATPAPKKISTPAGDRLSVIMESSAQAVHPALRPSRLANFSTLSLSRNRNNADHPPEAGAEKAPPKYSSLYGERGDEDQERQYAPGFKGQLQRRGGWKRVIACLIILITVIALALGIGLGVGLTRHSSSKSTPVAAPGSQPNKNIPPQDFPRGSYTITTYLDNISTVCSSNPITWNCPPSAVTGSTGPSAEFQFEWTINNSTSDPSELVVSSSNPFASFNPIVMTLADQGTENEHYTFSTTLLRSVVPNGMLTPDNVRTICFFNNTMFSGQLYTQKARTFPGPSNSTSSLTGTAGENWPFAVSVVYAAKGGVNVPNCYQMVNGNLGQRVTGLTVESSDAVCSCSYQNTGS